MTDVTNSGEGAIVVEEAYVDVVANVLEVVFVVGDGVKCTELTEGDGC